MTTVLYFEKDAPSVNVVSLAMSVRWTQSGYVTGGARGAACPAPADCVPENAWLSNSGMDGVWRQFDAEWAATVVQLAPAAPPAERRQKLAEAGRTFKEMKTTQGAAEAGLPEVGEWRWGDMVDGAGRLTAFGDEAFEDHMARVGGEKKLEFEEAEFGAARVLFEKLVACVVSVGGIGLGDLGTRVRRGAGFAFAADVERHEPPEGPPLD